MTPVMVCLAIVVFAASAAHHAERADAAEAANSLYRNAVEDARAGRAGAS